MESLAEMLALHTENARISKLPMFLIAVLFLIFHAMSVYCQFADSPQDVKTLDIGVNGDASSQTLSSG